MCCSGIAVAQVVRIVATAAYGIAMGVSICLCIATIYCNVTGDRRMRCCTGAACRAFTPTRLDCTIQGRTTVNRTSIAVSSADTRTMVATIGCDAPTVDGNAAALQHTARTATDAAANACAT